jgi:hypothetical protein
MSVYIFMKLSAFLQHIPFPVCKAQLIGHWYENKGGAPNTIIFFIIRQYYCAPMSAAPIVMADRTRKKNYLRTVLGQLCLLVEGDIAAPIFTSAKS